MANVTWNKTRHILYCRTVNVCIIYHISFVVLFSEIAYIWYGLQISRISRGLRRYVIFIQQNVHVFSIPEPRRWYMISLYIHRYLTMKNICISNSINVSNKRLAIINRIHGIICRVHNIIIHAHVLSKKYWCVLNVLPYVFNQYLNKFVIQWQF